MNTEHSGEYQPVEKADGSIHWDRPGDYVTPAARDHHRKMMRVWRTLAVIGRCQAEMERQHLVQGFPPRMYEFAWHGYFCTASFCTENQTDSHGECINCGEPVVAVYDPESVPAHIGRTDHQETS